MVKFLLRPICWIRGLLDPNMFITGHIPEEKIYSDLHIPSVVIYVTSCTRCGIRMGYRGKNSKSVEYNDKFQEN